MSATSAIDLRSDSQSTANASILNTRPSPMGETLNRQLNQHFVSHHFPTIVNQPIALGNNPLLTQWLADPLCAWVFISRTSVSYFKQFLLQNDIHHFSPKGGVFAIGESTKSELQQLITQPKQAPVITIITPKHANSESFLQLSEIQRYQTFVQIKGQGGRENIEQWVLQHKLNYFPLELYQRQPVIYPKNQVVTWLQSTIFLATSVDIAKSILANISQLDNNQAPHLLLQKIRWVVLSDRIKQFLIDNKIEQGHIFICEDSDNSSIINTINLISK